MRTLKPLWNHLLFSLAALCMTTGLASAATEEGMTGEAGSYINGGIGIDGRHAMRAERKNYNLRLVFAASHSGEYLAGLSVSIQRQGSNEEPVRYEDCGPLFYVKLPPGRYHITAEYEGKKQQLSTTVSAKGVDHVMYWR